MTKIHRNIEANVEVDASVKALRVFVEHDGGNGAELWFYDDGHVVLQSLISQGRLSVRQEVPCPV